MLQKVIPPKIPLSHVRKISNTCSFALQLPRQTLKINTVLSLIRQLERKTELILSGVLLTLTVCHVRIRRPEINIFRWI